MKNDGPKERIVDGEDGMDSGVRLDVLCTVLSHSVASNSSQSHRLCLPGSSVHRILQARILEWVVIPFSSGIFLTQGLNPGLLHCRKILYCLSHQGSPDTNFGKILFNQLQWPSFLFVR